MIQTKWAMPILAALTLTACHKNEEKKEEAVQYTISQPLVEDTTVDRDYVAQIQSLRNIEIRAMGRGFLQRSYANEGEYVHAGQTLFQIMPQVYQAEVMKNKAEVAQTQIELTNATKLANNNIVSKNEKAMAQAKLDAARAELQLSQLHLGFTRVTAPFSGILNRIPKKIGSLVDEGELLTTLSDNSEMYAYFNLPEPEYLDYQMHAAEHTDEAVSLVMANGEVMPERGYIQNIEGEFDPENGNIAFRAKFPNPKGLLRNGETGKVRIHKALHNAVIIPQKSTYELQDRKYVFVVGKDGRVHSRQIQVAYEQPNVYILSSGLQPGERYLVEGVQKAKDNDKIDAKYADPKVVMSSLTYKAN